MNDDGPDYRQAQEAEEMALWLQEQDAKRQERALTILDEMNADNKFREALETQHPWLKLWKEPK